MEYGIFNDEGCIEADFHSREEAQAAVAARYTEDDEVYVGEMSRDQDACEAGFEDEADDLDGEDA